MGLDTRVTPAQAARLVGVSRQLIYKWDLLGRLTKVNGKYLARDVFAAEAATRAKSGRPVKVAA